MNCISIGCGTNIQDNSLVHVAKSNLSGKALPTIVGDNVTVGEQYGSGHVLDVNQPDIGFNYLMCYDLKFELGRP